MPYDHHVQLASRRMPHVSPYDHHVQLASISIPNDHLRITSTTMAPTLPGYISLHKINTLDRGPICCILQLSPPSYPLCRLVSISTPLKRVVQALSHTHTLTHIHLSLEIPAPVKPTTVLRAPAPYPLLTMHQLQLSLKSMIPTINE